MLIDISKFVPLVYNHSHMLLKALTWNQCYTKIALFFKHEIEDLKKKKNIVGLFILRVSTYFH